MSSEICEKVEKVLVAEIEDIAEHSEEGMSCEMIKMMHCLLESMQTLRTLKAFSN